MLILVKKTDIKINDFLSILGVKLAVLNYDGDDTQYSFVIAAETTGKPLYYEHGITDRTQLMRNIVSNHKRKSSVVVVASNCIKAKTDKNPFPPFLINRQDYTFSGHELTHTFFLPCSKDHDDIDKQGRTLARNKFEAIINDPSVVIADVKDAFNHLKTDFVKALSAFYHDAPLIFISPIYGLKMHKEDQFTIAMHGVQYIEIDEFNIQSKQLVFGMSTDLRDQIKKPGNLMIGFHNNVQAEENDDDIVDAEINFTELEETDKSAETSEKQLTIKEKYPDLEEGDVLITTESYDIGSNQFTFSVGIALTYISDVYVTGKVLFAPTNGGYKKVDIDEIDLYTMFKIQKEK